ncbi:MAG: twin-arginine translocation signal domain-containing protein [Gemmataceae bacterium]|nr:twin-arginine translocation signal domain-containing protein [Gemmataceae bacterium]
MDRRRFLGLAGTAGAGLTTLLGCRGQQVGEVMKDNKKDLVGNTAAGAETYKPMIDDALAKLLTRQNAGLQPASTPAPPPGKKSICFVGLENKSSEALGDFKDQIVEIIDTKINTSQVFVSISRKSVEAVLASQRLAPKDLFIPENQRKFIAVMESQGMPFDYLLFATTTSGTTQSTSATQKDYLLSLELIDIRTGMSDKELSAPIRKAYSRSHFAR